MSWQVSERIGRSVLSTARGHPTSLLLDLSGIATMYSVETVRKVWQLGSYLRQELATLSAGKTPETLYQYTDAAGLSIRHRHTSGTVWATHYEYLNDASELKYAVGVMKGVVEKATTGAKPDSWKGRLRHVMSQGNITSDYSAGLEEGADRQQFLACFSEGGDKLSQWRGYGKSIGGYSLGFPFAHLRAIEKRMTDSQQRKAKSSINVEFFVVCMVNGRRRR